MHCSNDHGQSYLVQSLMMAASQSTPTGNQWGNSAAFAARLLGTDSLTIYLRMAMANMPFIWNVHATTIDFWQG